MKKPLTKNLGMKIISLILAIVLWYAIVNISDPVTTTKFYDVEVSFVNENVFSDSGQVYSVVDDTNLVKVTVTAPRSVITSLDENSFNIVADFSEYKKSNNTVPIRFGKNDERIQNLTLGHDELLLEVEDLVTRQIAVELETTGVPMEGYAVGQVTADPAVINVSGPASVMADVERVKATLDISDCFETVQSNCRVELLNADGEAVERDRISFSDEDIMVTAGFLPTKTIDLKFATTGKAAAGYAAIAIKAKPEVITICGQANDIANISVINIPAEELDITDLDKNLTKTINVEQYLEDKFKVLSSDGGNVEVTVSIEKVEEKVIKIPVSDITVKNLTSGLTYSFVDNDGNELDTVDVTVQASKDIIDDITTKDVKVTIDAAELNSGRHHVEAQITTPTGAVTEETWLSIRLKWG